MVSGEFCWFAVALGIAIATVYSLWRRDNRDMKRIGLHLCLIGGILCIGEASTSWFVLFGYYKMWWFFPNFLIIGTLGIAGAILGLKGNNTGIIVCIIAGISGFISTILLGKIWLGSYFYRIFLRAFLPFVGGLFVSGTLFIIVGGILACLKIIITYILMFRLRARGLKSG